MSGGRAARQRGFTLIEVIIVVVIIAVASAIIGPTILSGSRQREVRRTVQHFVGAVRQASAMAILQRREIGLAIRLEEREFAVGRKLAQRDADADEDAPRRFSNERARDEDDRRGGDGQDTDRRDREAVESLPDFAEFGDVEGGRLVSDDVVVFDFYPSGGSSGGSIELIFEMPRYRQGYVFTINPLISSVSIEEME